VIVGLDHVQVAAPVGCEDEARRFYGREGFVEVEHTDGAGNEEGEPDVRLEWRPPAAS